MTADGRHLICVWERHGADGVDNSLVVVPTDGSAGAGCWPRATTSSPPALSPDGRRLAWVAWDHPRMPWDGTELCQAVLSETLEITDVRVVAGGTAEAVQEPRYGADGSLYYISDRTGWWNLYLDGADGPVPLPPPPGRVRRAHVGVRPLLLRSAPRRQCWWSPGPRQAGCTSAPSPPAAS